jgi:polysaccharide biosynthesis/export protein
MTKFKLISLSISLALLLISCSKILEPVSLFAGKQGVETKSDQEDFEINIKGLTFTTAKKANKSSYSRRVILTGSGSKANVYDEASFLKSNLPKSSGSPHYLLGKGDQISFKQLNEFETEIAQWPSVSQGIEYLLGAGDELTFLQSNDINLNISSKYYDNSEISLKNNNDALITTNGVIGSNGNILLFGLGNILAANRTLDSVRTEVRNILIRNGQVPNFQLEISNFQSKKAFVTAQDGTSRTIALNSLPITLKEIALEYGLSESHKNSALIKLTKNGQEFRFTASQLFDITSPEIIIQDNDQIDIQYISSEETTVQSVVGLKGNILIPDVGSIPAVNRSIDDLYETISDILIGKGIKPNFQLELTKAVSQKAYLIDKNVGSTVVPLSTSKFTLRELILGNKNSTISTTGLSIITLKRNGNVFRMTSDYILQPNTPDILIVNNDQIEVEVLAYKPGQIFALSGAGNAQMVPISPSKRETLADVLFAPDGALNNLRAKRSEVYLLRGQNPSVAYHLDAQNVSRILVAAKTELRPNDIVYVADRPIISFSRTLSEIVPLRTLMRDIQNNAIP